MQLSVSRFSPKLIARGFLKMRGIESQGCVLQYALPLRYAVLRLPIYFGWSATFIQNKNQQLKCRQPKIKRVFLFIDSQAILIDSSIIYRFFLGSRRNTKETSFFTSNTITAIDSNKILSCQSHWNFTI